MQKVVTLNTCCHIACLTFQLPDRVIQKIKGGRFCDTVYLYVTIGNGQPKEPVVSAHFRSCSRSPLRQWSNWGGAVAAVRGRQGGKTASPKIFYN